MRKITKITFAVLISSFVLPPLALAEVMINPYFGADLGFKHTGFKPEYGKNVFKTSNQPIATISAGLELHPNVDLGFVLEHSLISTRSNTQVLIPTDVLVLGTLINGPLNYTGKVKFFSYGLDLMYKFNLSKYDKIQPLIGIGIKRVTLNLIANQKDGATPPDSIMYKNFDFTHHNTRTVFKIMSGIQYMITEQIGGRILLNWENSSVLRLTDITKESLPIANLKNSFGATAGIIIRL